MDTKNLVIESSFNAGTTQGGVTVISQKPTTGGCMVTLGRAFGGAADALILDVYHDIAGNGFTTWPNPKTLNDETLVIIMAAFDEWLAKCPAKSLDVSLVRVYNERRDQYRDARIARQWRG